MADTRYLRRDVERYVREQLAARYGQAFEAVDLELTTGGRHEFDAVSRDRSVVGTIKASSGLTVTGKRPIGKIKNAYTELHFLSLVQASTRLLILTDPAFHAIFVRDAIGRVQPDILIDCIPLPSEMQAEVAKVTRAASNEMARRRARPARPADGR